ncbi:hypothetical protein A3D88_00845 [Candidatus Peribacteria bacterium RIFCSPHIGHO2_02_FULL_52_16]|nr:MAG: hypothetical protein A2706_05490 [Candidatus Peribacteria bacterium RIFCSPHIGHO2_01_FULL_51_35]OGJ61214.1 MAG: hypothetical protein A3D88_00845 [Candidatus Peribacteria bacterium RIFCSPHIGHO2_02_FULL_52_16]
MTDPNPPSQGSATLTISDEIRAQFPDLIELILKSESMNDEERQYWINILPIMTPEQVQDLKNILNNEKKQLQAIDQKYATEIDQVGKAEVIKITDEERRKKREERAQKEAAHASHETESAEDILRKIEGNS